jgi:hypothetical protein
MSRISIRTGLLVMVSQRRKLLDYLKRTDGQVPRLIEMGYASKPSDGVSEALIGR